MRALNRLTIRAVDADQRLIEGVATTPNVDRMGDVVQPMGAKFTLPIPLLWQHNAAQPVGLVTVATPTPSGIRFSARITKMDEPGTLKDRTDEAWQSVKAGLVGSVSIGFTPLPGGASSLKDGGVEFSAWDWLELSLVTVPANADCTITSVKAAREAIGRRTARRVVRLTPGDHAVAAIITRQRENAARRARLGIEPVPVRLPDATGSVLADGERLLRELDGRSRRRG